MKNWEFKVSLIQKIFLSRYLFIVHIFYFRFIKANFRKTHALLPVWNLLLFKVSTRSSHWSRPGLHRRLHGRSRRPGQCNGFDNLKSKSHLYLTLFQYLTFTGQSHFRHFLSLVLVWIFWQNFKIQQLIDIFVIITWEEIAFRSTWFVGGGKIQTPPFSN